MNITAYIKALQRSHALGTATEHTYRPALQALLESAIPKAQITNEPRQIECGAPDFVLTRNKIPFGYIETKDIGRNLDDKAYNEQLKRYTNSLNNLLFTDYLEFRYFRDGGKVSKIVIGAVVNGKIQPKPENFTAFADMLETFAGYEGQTITTADGLATQMALKARMLATVIDNALTRDESAAGEISAADNALTGQLATFKKYLIHDLEAGEFADIYAQTVAYGMFAARLHDPTPQTFSREEAAGLIPVTNPFLRKFFQHIAGHDLDKRIHWIVDDLADLFRAADVGELMKGYGKATGQDDPFMHFYETFLSKYDPKTREQRGVYYTPEPVVNFIVRAVDDILRTEFSLPKGIADTRKVTKEIGGQKKEIHKVQILDPATGTGTFLAAIVREIYTKYFASQKGTWPDYVKKELIPRLNGFEVLMASYAMAHTKLEMVLRESNCKMGDERLRIYLTNSLEKHHPDTGSMFEVWLSTEANEANSIKRDTPVMVVIGNPPYSGESANNGEWISDLINSYKQEPGGGPLQETNPRWLNDDYVKFIRYGQHCIDRTGEGVLAYINNNSFLDNSTFRGMRWNLLQSFDKIYILDLHGNSMAAGVAPEDSSDKNVFDIRQGVSINLFIKTGKKKKNDMGKIFYFDIYGERESKYEFLRSKDFGKVNFKKLNSPSPDYFFVPKDYKLKSEYDRGFSVNDLFLINSVGIVTARDKFTIHHSPKELKAAIEKFRALDDESAREMFSLGRDAEDWKVSLARKDLEDNVFSNGNDEAVPIYYRPFDIRYTYYTGKSRGFLCRPRSDVMRHFIRGENIGLIFKRGRIEESSAPIFLTKNISDSRSWSSPGMQGIESSAPLYVYPETKQQCIDNKQLREPNLDKNIVQKIADGLALSFTFEKQSDLKTFAPIDIFDYIYAVLHSPDYRRKYMEFLKIDFPRVPYPTDSKTFRKLAKLGAELRALHLMESSTLDNYITDYPETGNNIIAKLEYEITNAKTRIGKVQINDKQYFEKVPEAAWNFPVGGYLPAQKWLKDRKGRQLTHGDIIHYQKIIVALTETARLMEKIDEVDFIKKS